MAKKEQKLNNYISGVNINTISSSIHVYSDKVKEPIVRYTGSFEIDEKTKNTRDKSSEVSICEKKDASTRRNNASQTVVVNGNGVSINIGSNISIINCNGLQIGNGKIITNGGEIVKSERSSLELIVPKEISDLSFNIDSKSGSVTVEDLLLKKLYVKTLSGSITLRDLDALFARLETLSGNIDMTIIESILNYRALLKSLSGRTIQESVEKTVPEMLETKRQLEANSLSGNVKLIFKGKQ